MNFYHVTFSGWLGSTNFLLFPLLSALVLAGEVSACNFLLSRNLFLLQTKKDEEKSPQNNFSVSLLCVLEIKFKFDFENHAYSKAREAEKFVVFECSTNIKETIFLRRRVIENVVGEIMNFDGVCTKVLWQSESH